jgi:hypothetical protein
MFNNNLFNDILIFIVEGGIRKVAFPRIPKAANSTAQEL